MKILAYYFSKWVLKRHSQKSDYHQEVALWSLICLKNFFIIIFIVIPLVYTSIIEYLGDLTPKEKAALYSIPIFIIDFFIFFGMTDGKKFMEKLRNGILKKERIIEIIL